VVVRRFPFVVFFEERDDEVRVYAVSHGNKDFTGRNRYPTCLRASPLRPTGAIASGFATATSGLGRLARGSVHGSRHSLRSVTAVRAYATGTAIQCTLVESSPPHAVAIAGNASQTANSSLTPGGSVLFALRNNEVFSLQRSVLGA
jgi:hypothetical protein